MLPMAVGWSSFGGVAIRCVLVVDVIFSYDGPYGTGDQK